jgi:hypothetical protein
MKVMTLQFLYYGNYYVYSDHFLVRGKYRCKVAHNKHEPNRKTKKLHIDAL